MRPRRSLQRRGRQRPRPPRANWGRCANGLGSQGQGRPAPVTLDTAPLAEAAEAAQKAGNAAARGRGNCGRRPRKGRRGAERQVRAAVADSPGGHHRAGVDPVGPAPRRVRISLRRPTRPGAGVAIFALVMSHGNENVFWVTLTLVSVLQTNMPQTLVKTVQRVAGTLVGVVLAIALSLVLPTAVLVPWLAGAAILVGLAFQRRNYAVMSGLIAFAIVLLFGAPTNKVLSLPACARWMWLSAGCWRRWWPASCCRSTPTPAVRREQAIEALRSLQAAIQQRLADPAGISIEKVLGGRPARRPPWPTSTPRSRNCRIGASRRPTRKTQPNCASAMRSSSSWVRWWCAWCPTRPRRSHHGRCHEGDRRADRSARGQVARARGLSTVRVAQSESRFGYLMPEPSPDS